MQKMCKKCRHRNMVLTYKITLETAEEEPYEVSFNWGVLNGSVKVHLYSQSGTCGTAIAFPVQSVYAVAGIYFVAKAHGRYENMSCNTWTNRVWELLTLVFSSSTSPALGQRIYERETLASPYDVICLRLDEIVSTEVLPKNVPLVVIALQFHQISSIAESHKESKVTL